MDKFTLLIADDEEEIIKNLRFDLRDVAKFFLVAKDGVEALTLLQNNKVDCILTDINMPNKTGLEFAKEARDLKFNTPIIFLTAHGDEENMQQAIAYGAHDFIDKPYDVDELVKTVSEALEIGNKINESDEQTEFTPKDVGELKKHYIKVLKR